MDEFLLMTVIVVIANGIFDAVVVAYLAGRRSKEALVTFLNSSEADPYYSKIAAKASQEMSPVIDQKIASIKMPEIPKPNYAEIRLLVREEISRIPMPEIPELPEAPDFQALQSSIILSMNEQLNAMMPAIVETVQTALKEEIRAVKAAETRKLGQELKEYGLGIDEMGGALREEMMSKASEGMSPAQIAAVKFLQQKPSAAWIEENPGSAAFLEFAKMMAIQMASGEISLNGQSAPKPINAKKAVSSNAPAKSGIYG